MSFEKEEYFILSSALRNVTSFPQVNSFRNNIPSTLKNVSEIEVVSILLPKVTALNTQGILFLVLNETLNINKVIIPPTLNTNSVISKAFCPLPLSGATSTNFISADIADSVYRVKLLPAKDISNYFSVQIKDLQGNLFSFGESAGDLTTANQLTLVLKIKYNCN